MLFLSDLVVEIEKLQDCRDNLFSKINVEEAMNNQSLFESIDATEKYLFDLLIPEVKQYNKFAV